MNTMRYYSKHVVACVALLCTAAFMTAQSDTRMQFFPATDNHYAGLNVYSTTTGEYNQYFVENGEWVKNKFIPQPKLSIKGGDYRMDFIPGTNLQYAGLFVYSRNSGEFELFYLENNEWKSNGLFPKSKITFNDKKVIIEMTPAKGQEVAYLTVYSVDGERFGLYYVDGIKWVKSELYP